MDTNTLDAHRTLRQYMLWYTVLLFKCTLLYRHFENVSNALRYRNKQLGYLCDYNIHRRAGRPWFKLQKLRCVQKGSADHPTNPTNTGGFPPRVLRLRPAADQTPPSSADYECVEPYLHS
jgi:hypothetical protein